MMKLKHYFLPHELTTQREKKSEWIGAPVTSSLCERKKNGAKETCTPSDRVLGPCRRTTNWWRTGVRCKGSYWTFNWFSDEVRSHRDKTRLKRNSQIWLAIHLLVRCLHLLSRNHTTEQTSNYDQLPPSLDGGLNNDPSNTVFLSLNSPIKDF